MSKFEPQSNESTHKRVALAFSSVYLSGTGNAPPQQHNHETSFLFFPVLSFPQGYYLSLNEEPLIVLPIMKSSSSFVPLVLGFQ